MLSLAQGDSSQLRLFSIDSEVVFIGEHSFPFAGNIGGFRIGLAHMFQVESTPAPGGFLNDFCIAGGFRRSFLFIIASSPVMPRLG